MKIAIIAPSGVPFVRGGAENLWLGMLQSLNKEQGTEAELIKIPAPERDLEEIIDSYMTFAQLDLLHFDQVITTKYPAWMIYHPNHVIYLQHKLRGLYDTYQGVTQLPGRGRFPQKLHKLYKYLNTPPDSRSALADVFYDLHVFMSLREELPADWYSFPGPMSRSIVHMLDHIALAGGRIQRFCAISDTVAKRTDHFPAQATVEVFYHPTSLEGLQSGEFQYFFTASRLDKPKRVDLIIKAWLAAETNVPLYIAGTGPCEPELRALAAENPAIRFLGFVTDVELAGYYANALAVIFVPDREDYGLITVEAMLCAKPVLTVADAGGVTELVKHDVNGWVAEPTVESLAIQIKGIGDQPERVKMLGQAAKAYADTISWHNLNRFLVVGLRKKLVLINTFQVNPPLSGGQLRIYHLYRWLAREMNVVLISLVPYIEAGRNVTIAPGLREITIPRSESHQQKENSLGKQLGISAGDIAALKYYRESPEWLQCIASETADADWVVASHPYGINALRAAYKGPFVYESHNMELDLKQDMLAGGNYSEVLQVVERAEALCVHSADLVTTCTQSDLQRYKERYDMEATGAVIPNGVNIEGVPFISLSERQGKNKGRLSALFMGSLHKPNILAAEYILVYARECPDLDFFILGSVCKALQGHELPENLQLLGMVDDETKLAYLARAELALNPMTMGSGSNLKMLEAAAVGQLIISTPFGGRGDLLRAGVDYLEAEVDGFTGLLNSLSRDGLCEYAAITEHAYQQVVEKMDWQSIAGVYRDVLSQHPVASERESTG